MRSKWYGSRGRALRLRKEGHSYREIESRLGIPRSTLSGWFKDIKLSSEQREKLSGRWKQGLVKARKRAALWHNKQKRMRLEDAERQALSVLAKINSDSAAIQELALAALYMGEGRKRSGDTSLGSSDPLILKFFLAVLKGVYKVDSNKIRCSLYLRADQDDEDLKNFWSSELGLPLSSFVRVYKDKRTAGSKSYSDYKGVCDVRCGGVAIRRKLMSLSRLFCERVSSRNLGL